MTDLKLLKLAAKAALYKVNFKGAINGWYPFEYDANGDVKSWWNPLKDDGDALRLAVRMGMHIDICSDYINVSLHCEASWEDVDEKKNRCAATRRAIVNAAAQYGRRMP